MNGDQQVPPVASGGLGSGSFTVHPDSRLIGGNVKLDGITATAVGVYIGVVGGPGELAFALVEGPQGTWTVPTNTTLTSVQLAFYEDNNLYVSARTATNPNGEIRGQVGQEVFHAALTGSQEVPPVASGASGKATLMLNPATKGITGRIQATGLTGTMAHIHAGTVGTNGAVTINLTETPAASGTWSIPANTVLTDAQITTLRDGGFYFNVHTAAKPNGEIRGQIGRKVRVANLSGAQEVPPVASAATGLVQLVINPATRGVSGSISTTGLVATAAQLQQAGTGANGPVVVGMTANLTASGSWTIADKTMLTATAYKALLDGNVYANVLTAARPTGEIRAQIAP